MENTANTAVLSIIAPAGGSSAPVGSLAVAHWYGSKNRRRLCGMCGLCPYPQQEKKHIIRLRSSKMRPFPLMLAKSDLLKAEPCPHHA